MAGRRDRGGRHHRRVMASRIIKPLYRAQGDHLDRLAGAAPRGAGAFPARAAPRPEAWLDLMRSYAVLDEAARAERLYLHAPEKTPPALFTGFAVADTFRAGSYRLVGDGRGTDSRPTTDRAGTGPRQEIRWAAPSVFAGSRRRGPLLRGRRAVRGGDVARCRPLNSPNSSNCTSTPMAICSASSWRARSGKAGAGLDRISGRYVEVAGELKRQKLNRTDQDLSEQLAGATADLVSAESTFEAFRARTITLPSERVSAGAATTPAGGVPGPVIRWSTGTSTSRGSADSCNGIARRSSGLAGVSRSRRSIRSPRRGSRVNWAPPWTS